MEWTGGGNVVFPTRLAGTSDDTPANTQFVNNAVSGASIVVNVLNFGADPTGVADSTTAIQNAINSLSGGGIVYIPPGSYLYSTLDLPSFTMLVGSGIGSTRLIATGTSGDTITIGNGTTNPVDVAIRDIRFFPASQMTSGSVIRVRNAHNIRIRDIYIPGRAFVGVFFEGGAQQFEYFLEDFEINACTNNCVLVGSSAGAVQDLYIHNGVSNPGSGNGLNMINVGGAVISNWDIITGARGVVTFPSAGMNVEFVRFVNVFCDTCVTAGFSFIDNGGNLSYIQVVSCWGCSTTTASTGHGLNVNSSNLNGLIVTGGDYGNNQADGIAIQLGSNVLINGVSCWGNVNAGIAIGSNVNDFQILNSLSGNYGVINRTPAFGVIVASGTSNNYIIMGNRTPGNTTGLSDGGSGANKIVTNNGNW